MQTTLESVFPEDCTIIELACQPARGIGFRNNGIEYFDGQVYRPVSLKQSLQLYILLLMRHEVSEGSPIPETCAAAAYLKWLRMIARELN